MNRLSGSITESSSMFSGVLVNSTIFNKGTDDQLECIGYRDSTFKKVAFYFLVFVTLGLILLFLYWGPEWEIYLKKTRCSLVNADRVLLKDPFGHIYVAKVDYLHLDDGLPLEGCYQDTVFPENFTSSLDTANLITLQGPALKYFDHHHIRYIWDHSLNDFKRLQDLSSNTLCTVIHRSIGGLSAEDQANRLKVYGRNRINIEVKSYWKLLIEEVLNPFYIFQIGSIILWTCDQYYYYACCIFFISCVSICISLYETRKQSINLHNMVASSNETIQVRRGTEDFVEVSSQELVPGDVIMIPPHGCVLTCDAALITGTCIVNESMLTGESVPVTKTPLSHQEEDEVYSSEIHKRHTLFAGTYVVQTRYYGHAKVLAVVVRTGFNTAKGELVNAILFPKPIGFKFYKDAFKFVFFLGFLSCIGMVYSIWCFLKNQVTLSEKIIRVLDIITIVVPPALPAAMTVGMVYAQHRLKKQKIFCTSPPRINFCGKLNLFCFDKTGTLTEDGLDLWAVVPTNDNCFQPLSHNPSELPCTPLVICMASCHSLTLIGGELMGDPLDLKMFLSLKWEMEEPGTDNTRFDCLMPTVVRPRCYRLVQSPNTSMPRQVVVMQEPGQDTSKFDMFTPTVVRPCTKDMYASDGVGQTPFEVGIVRQFTFTSSLQRMSVVVRTLGSNHMDAYSKGAPEKIASLCQPSTVPEDFQDVLYKYTVQGFRVIALAWKKLDPKLTWHQVQRISRNKVECDLEFLGLLVMMNTLKPQTTTIINTLKSANIKTVMVTGDMILTAISVARNCNMVNPHDKVIIVNAYPPENEQPAQIRWEYAECPSEESISDSDNQETSPLLFPNMSKVDFQDQTYQAIDVNLEAERYHFAVSGKAFSVIRNYFPQLLPKICIKGTVFARMAPDQKAQLVNNLQDLGYSVGMCGDGANDCEALKAAHAGISLSETEASVAAPFTSQNNNIECVVTVIREGRAALVTSFGCFKYMALYSIIQFVSVLILYTYGLNMSDLEYLYIDLVITTSLAVLMGYTEANNYLAKRKPTGNLLKASNLISIILQIFIVIAFQSGAIISLQSQTWYKETFPFNTENSTERTKSYESTVVFLISSYQYITVAFAFSKGPPHRKMFYTNIPFLLMILLLIGFSTFLLMCPFKKIQDFFQMKLFPDPYYHFQITLLLLVVCNWLTSIFIEFLTVDSNYLKMLLKKLECKKILKSKYKLLEQELCMSPEWPPVGGITYPEDCTFSLSNISHFR